MSSISLRGVLVAAGLLAIVMSSTRAAGDQCRTGCAAGERVCTVQTRLDLLACRHGCAPNDSPCSAACLGALHSSRAMCRATRSDCNTACPQAEAPSTAPDSTSCAADCGMRARMCFADALAAGKSCAATCVGNDGSVDQGCMKQCAAAIGDRQATCLAMLESCLGDCQPPVSGTCFSTVDMQCTAEPCGPTQPCSQPSEFCSERCAAPPPSGTCFDPSTEQCSGQTCSPTQRCLDAGQICLAVCPPPGPRQHCFDTTTKQCTDEECDDSHPCESTDQICTLQCPPPPAKGTCFETSAMQCLDTTCSREQPCAQPNQRCVPQCPPPTPVPPCSTLPCAGPCAVTPECAAGQACPALALRGQCVADAAGSCSCVPVSPPPTRTPRPTGTPQCDSAACSGPCTLSSCPPNVPCDDALEKTGQCQISSAGTCDCVPVTPTPRATPTPQCGGPTCGGPCEIGPPDCDPGKPCPEFPTRRGQCSLDDAGNCGCVPVSPPPTRSPEPTPPSPCDAAACGGPCTVSFPCPPDAPCKDLPEISGQCTTTANGGCECIPTRPSPPPTPTPQCAGAMCGGSCDFGASICPPGALCPEIRSQPGECALDAAGNCRCVPASPPPTPSPAPSPHQCDANACGGRCFIPLPCPDGPPCPAATGPSAVLLGECTTTASGGCDCVPVSTGP